MNKVILIGRLTRDAEMRYTQDGMSIANLTLAVPKSRKRDGEPDAYFIRCTAFGKTAEAVQRYTAKGSRIMAEGELQIEAYTDKQGQSRTATSVSVQRVEFLDSRQDNQRQTTTQPQAEFQPAPQAQDPWSAASYAPSYQQQKLDPWSAASYAPSYQQQKLDPWSAASYAPSYQQQKLQPGDFAPIEPDVSDDPDLPF